MLSQMPSEKKGNDEPISPSCKELQGERPRLGSSISKYDNDSGGMGANVKQNVISFECSVHMPLHVDDSALIKTMSVN